LKRKKRSVVRRRARTSMFFGSVNDETSFVRSLAIVWTPASPER